MLNTLILASLFAINAGLVVYLLINEKMHAQPWRFLALAFISLIVVFWLQTSIETMATSLDKLIPTERHFEDLKLTFALVSTVIGAFAGALIGTAVTNRAMLLNSKKLKELKEREERCKATFLRAEDIRKELESPTAEFSHEEFMKKHELREHLLAKYIDKIHEIQEERDTLTL